MTGAGIGSTVARRQLGRYLRVLREKTKLKTTEVAEAMDWSQPTVSRIETGQTPVRAIDVDRMCRIYGADQKTAAELMTLARKTREPDWWRTYGDAAPPWLDLLLGLEQVASCIRTYEAHVVPGMLQTAEYARELMRHQAASMAEMRIKLRMERQALLTRKPNPPQYQLLLDEAVLHRPLTAPEVMAEQLNKLVKVGELPHVTIRVLPYSAGFHDGLISGPFVIMDFPQDDMKVSERTTVYVESFSNAMYIDKPQAVADYVNAFNNLRNVALDDQASRDLIHQVLRSPNEPA